MLAAYHGHAELVKFLIQHGADPNRLNDRRQSPLAGAVFKKEEQVIEVSQHGVCIFYTGSRRVISVPVKSGHPHGLQALSPISPPKPKPCTQLNVTIGTLERRR